MKVYKYRAAIEFERDLQGINNNYFYAPNSEKLNDPCETLVFSDNFKKESLALVKVFGKEPNDSLIKLHEVVDNFIARREKIGIYSLSKRFDDELMWAHYANNHSGFCIEYDYDILLNGNSFSNFYTFSVEYKKSPPQVDILDMLTEKKRENKILKKLAGTKSKRWSYEEEIRIITDKFGKHYYDFRAVKSIYFGYRMNDNEKDKIMKSLSGRDIKYFQISLNEKSYSFYPIELEDKYKTAQKYLFKYYRKSSVVNYEIIEQNYLFQFNKGELSISLEHKLTEKELKDLGLQLRDKLYKSAEVVYIFYYLPDCADSTAWAITHFEKDKSTININGITIEKEKEFLELIKKDTRDIINQWIDSSAFLSSLITLFKENGKIYMETLYSNNSKSIKEQKLTIVENGVRYDNLQSNTHGEYVIVTKENEYVYYTPDGEYLKIKNNL